METQVPGFSQCVLSATVHDASKDSSAAMFRVKQAEFITSGKLVNLY